MKKSGFTIVELMGVIVILAILVTIGVGVYTNVFEHEQEKTYENKVSMIELAAEKWASESNLSRPTTITVQRLIDENYYQADSYNEKDQEYIVEDPRDKSSMICQTIDITLDNSSPSAKVNETKDCNLVSQEEDAKNVNIMAYSYDSETKKVMGNLNMVGENIDWTKTAVLLVVNPDGYFTTKDGSKIEYNKVIFSTGANEEEKIVSGNILTGVSNGMLVNEANYSNAYTVDASLFLNALYTVSLETEEGIKSKDTMVRIDKEAPEVEAEMTEEYTTEDKEITIRGNDGAGSGLKGFYVSTSSDNKGTEFYPSTYETKVRKPTGTYYLYGEDQVGNVSETGEKLEVGNIDSSVPSCQISVIEGTLGKNGWYTSDVKIKMTSSNAKGTGVSYGLTTSNIPSYTTGFLRENETINKEEILKEDKIHHYYGYVKNAIGVTGKCELEVKVDRAVPKATVKKDPLELGNQDYNFKDNIQAEFGPSGGSVVCNPPTSKQTGTYNVTCTITGNNGLETTKTFQVKVDVTPPKATVKQNPLTLGNQDYNFKDNIQAEFGILGGSVICNPPSSKKTGTYNVTCTIRGNNGLEITKTFQVKHSYKATFVSNTCTDKRVIGTYSCCVSYGPTDDGGCCDWDWDAGCHGDMSSCAPSQYCRQWGCQVCKEHGTCNKYEDYSYECGKYICPQGGTPNGDTCYY